MICPAESFEGENILIDGSGSNDGVWTNNLQYVWYVTKPDGTIYVPNSSDSSVLDTVLNESGTHTIRLDVIDWVGRMNSTSYQILVKNSEPVLGMEIEGVDVTNPNSWQFIRGENVSLQPSVIDSGDNIDVLSFSWYIDSTFVSDSQQFSIVDLDEGSYVVLLIVTDDDGANASYEIEILIKSQTNDENNDWNYGSIIVLIGIIGFSIVMFNRLKGRDSESKSLPKWNEPSAKTGDNTSETTNHDNELWD